MCSTWMPCNKSGQRCQHSPVDRASPFAAAQDEQRGQVCSQPEDLAGLRQVPALKLRSGWISGDDDIMVSAEICTAFFNGDGNPAGEARQGLQSQAGLDIRNIEQAARTRALPACQPASQGYRHGNKPTRKQHHIRLEALDQAARLQETLDQLPEIARQAAQTDAMHPGRRYGLEWHTCPFHQFSLHASNTTDPQYVQSQRSFAHHRSISSGWLPASAPTSSL